MKKASLNLGMRVTCRVAVPAYYSGYGGKPVMVFRPGMIGIISRIAPKVVKTVPNKAAGIDGCNTFAVVDYDCPETGQSERVGLNLCNIVQVD